VRRIVPPGRFYTTKTIPGLGPVTASAMAAGIQDVSVFSGPREFAAFLGLTPKQNGTEKLDEAVLAYRAATI
jgi:transposase